MYDTINFKLSHDEAGGVNFIEETPCYLDDVGQHLYNSGMPFVTGSLDGLKVAISPYQVRVTGGSLCKYLLGDNFQTMGRADVKRAIEKMSDSLHLPMDRAAITRLDVAQNLIMKHPPDVYLSHLGLLPHTNRLQQPHAVYYTQKYMQLCFYDKVEEQRQKHKPIPEIYRKQNVLRYEQRFKGRIAAKFKVPKVTGATLYDEAFYMRVLDGWKAEYLAIGKINDITPNFGIVKGVKELDKRAVLEYVEKRGGQLAFIDQIAAAQRKGELTKKQALDLKRHVNEACKVDGSTTTQSDAIIELNKKMSEAVRYYR